MLDLPPKIRPGEAVTIKPHQDGSFTVSNGDTERFDRPRFEDLTEYTHAPAEWLWTNRIPKYKVTLIEGAEGSGKTFVAFSIAAAVMQGKPFYDGPQHARRPGNVLIISNRDSISDTVSQRLHKTGADFERVFVYSCVDTVDGPSRDKARRNWEFPQDFVILETLALKHNCRMIIIDTLAEFCPAKKIPEMLQRLDQLARTEMMTVIVTACTAPRRDARGVVRIRTPKCYSSVRNAWCVMEDAEDRKLRHFVPTRTTFCEEPVGVAFRIKKSLLTWEPLPPPPIDLRRQARLDTEQWLKQELEPGGVPARNVLKSARECGMSNKLLYEARLRLGVQTLRIGLGGEGGWWWQFVNEEASVESAAAQETQDDSPPDEDEILQQIRARQEAQTEWPPYKAVLPQAPATPMSPVSAASNEKPGFEEKTGFQEGAGDLRSGGVARSGDRPQQEAGDRPQHVVASAPPMTAKPGGQRRSKDQMRTLEEWKKDEPELPGPNDMHKYDDADYGEEDEATTEDVSRK